MWQAIRTNVGHMGHFTRLEFNPTPGVPDVDYVTKGAHGKLELKHCPEWPKRITTAIPWGHQLDDAQIAWMYAYTKHGGRAYILGKVSLEWFLVPGSHCQEFNSFSRHQLGKAAVWQSGGISGPVDWGGFIKLLREAR